MLPTGNQITLKAFSNLLMPTILKTDQLVQVAPLLQKCCLFTGFIPVHCVFKTLKF